MGVVEKLKRLHKQTLLKLNNIKRVVIADEAGVNNEEYLNRARTLNSYLNPNLKEEEDSKEEEIVNEEESIQSNHQKVQQAVSPEKTSSKSSSKKTKPISL